METEKAQGKFIDPEEHVQYESGKRLELPASVRRLRPINQPVQDQARQTLGEPDVRHL